MSAVLPVGSNHTRLWGLTPRERLARIARSQGIDFAAGAGGGPLLANLDYVFDPAWVKYVTERPDHAVTFGGVPVLAHATDLDTRLRATLAMKEGRPFGAGAGLTLIAYEESGGLQNEALRKRERPFLGPLTPDSVRSLERASYAGAYKGVTDLLTKYLWPEWAFHLTRGAARLGLTPNQVTLVGALLCIAATFLFFDGWYWSGLAAGLAFMVLDTVDGKLARCTLTSSRLGDILDHGVDLIHPPFWWWAWGEGLEAYGRPLSAIDDWGALAVIVAGYIAGRGVEGAFLALFRIEIHVWRRFDSRFRLVTARRNPNMVILMGFLAAGRPDLGLIAVAAWTVISLLVHIGRLVEAVIARRRGRPVVSWLA
jgi:phosphatidylglycerophosphate synthase